MTQTSASDALTEQVADRAADGFHLGHQAKANALTQLCHVKPRSQQEINLRGFELFMLTLQEAARILRHRRLKSKLTFCISLEPHPQLVAACPVGGS